MSERIIICPNYGAIKDTLYLAASNYHDNRVTIIVAAKHNLLRFFQVINEKVFQNNIKLILLEPYSTGRGASKGIFRKVFGTLADIIRERQYLKRMWYDSFSELRDAVVFFPTRVVSGYLFFLLKKFSKNNELVFIPFYTPPYTMQMQSYIPKNMIDFAYFIIRKLTYGRDISIASITTGEANIANRWRLKDTVPFVPDKFMGNYVSKVIELEEKNSLMKDFDFSQFKVFGIEKYSVIYFDSALFNSPIEGLIPDRDSYKRELTEIFATLLKYFPEKEIARKYHPNHPTDELAIEVGDVIPDYIPAELIYTDSVKLYLGIFSGAIANIEKGPVVSIAYLLPFKDDKVIEKYIKFFTQSNRSEILFPKSLEEFEKILSKIKRDHNMSKNETLKKHS